MANDPAALSRARADFLAHYQAEMSSKKVEYLEHKPVIEEFRTEAQKTQKTQRTEDKGP
jgi:hypothetical protein